MRNRVQAAVLEAPGKPLRLTEVLLDEPVGDEVVVRAENAGLCHSDLHYLRGSLPIDVPAILGHEVAGHVESTGPAVTRLQPGDRVVATVTPACGQCARCLAGRPTQCRRADALRARERPRVTTPDGVTVGLLGNLGAFATAFLASESSLAVVPDDMPSRVACLLGCCVSTGVGAVVHGAQVRPSDTVVVIGCGGVGIAAIQGAHLAGARQIVAVDTSPQKLDLARHFGATDGVVAGPEPGLTRRRLEELCPGGFDHAFEAVGRPETAELAFDLLGSMGTATVLGLMPVGARLSLSADELVFGDRKIQGAYMGANRFLTDIEVYGDHYRSGRLDLDAMVTTELPFDEIDAGFVAMARPDSVRVVVTFPEG